MSDLCRGLNMGQGSVSKNVKMMSQWMEGNELKGYGLIRTEQDLKERRRFNVVLTPKGEKLLQDICASIDLLLNSDKEVKE